MAALPEQPDKLDIYLNHRAALVDYAAPIVGCRAQAEDVVQDAWLRFAQNPSSSLPMRQPVGYLYRIVRNLALDVQRRLGRERRPDDSQAALGQLPSTTPDPERQVSSQAQLRRLHQSVQTLPPRTREAFALHRLEGLTLQEVARRLDISVGLAHQLVRAALSHCAEQLDDH
ncbi:DNA-directed RNA polymerase sigma-70 factor [Pseudomonas fluvialis]|uniref:DNA-directed RNA polymerase sigma-70 factor n=1 Tax=Pseudomonas fluvialis TaxID=1793966 RepID=A0ABQ2AE26_9PSED|nr:DNA-directed RNA polymerase sigma-70 factor [Pseudomonas fluvialis]